MGWQVVNSDFISGSTTARVPAGVRDGDVVILSVLDNNSNTNVTPPTGYALLGGSTQQHVQNGSVFTTAIFYKVWHTGDPTTGLTFTTGSGAGNTSWVSIIARPRNTGSWSATSLQQNINNGNTNFAVKKMIPSVVGDLRLAYFFPGTVSGGGQPAPTPLAVTPSANNPTGVQMQRYFLTGNGGFETCIYIGYWEDPSGLDANDENWTTNFNYNGLHQYSFVLTDGDGISPAGADEEAMYQAIVDVAPYELQQAGQDADSANANWWGGGPALASDYD